MNLYYESYTLADNLNKLNRCLYLIKCGNYYEMFEFMNSLYNSDIKVISYVELRKLLIKPTYMLSYYDLKHYELPIVSYILMENIQDSLNIIYNQKE